MSDYVSAEWVAQKLGVSDKTIKRMAEAREIPCFKVRKQWRFSREVVEQMIRRAIETQEFC